MTEAQRLKRDEREMILQGQMATRRAALFWNITDPEYFKPSRDPLPGTLAERLMRASNAIHAVR